MNKYIINKKFEELTETEKMILSIKGAIEEIKKGNNEEFYGAFLVAMLENLKALGIDKEEIFKYRFVFK